MVVEVSDSEGSSKGFRGKLYSYADLWEVRGYKFEELFHFDFYNGYATRYDFKDAAAWGTNAQTTHSDVLKIDLALLLEPLPA